MLVICEECAKKYNIDERRIKGPQARFACQECGHIIVVKNPGMQDELPALDESAGRPAEEEKPHRSEAAARESVPRDEAEDEEATAELDQPGINDTVSAETPESETQQSRNKKGRGVPIRLYLFMTLFLGFLMVTGAIAFLYLQFIPDLINRQINLRTSAVAMAFSGVVQQPLLIRNYLQVNKEAERISRLPGVAYAAVVNKRGIVVAGFFSDLNRFDPRFLSRVKEKGFPREIIEQNRLAKGIAEQDARLDIGGQKIFDKAVGLKDSGGEVHVGIYVSDVDQAIRDTLLSPLSLGVLAIVWLSGLLVFLFLGRIITSPLRKLTEIVDRISLGELDLAIEPEGPREVRELAVAFDRMRHSIKAAIGRLRAAR